MSKTKEELVRFRLERADESFKMANLAMENNFFNSAASEIYYTCFYLIIALFAQNDIHTTTHKGVKRLFGLHFIKEGKVNERWGELFGVLFNKRQQSDYADFALLDQNELKDLLNEAEEFRNIILKLLDGTF